MTSGRNVFRDASLAEKGIMNIHINRN